MGDNSYLFGSEVRRRVSQNWAPGAVGITIPGPSLANYTDAFFRSEDEERNDIAYSGLIKIVESEIPLYEWNDLSEEQKQYISELGTCLEYLTSREAGNNPFKAQYKPEYEKARRQADIVNKNIHIIVAINIYKKGLHEVNTPPTHHGENQISFERLLRMHGRKNTKPVKKKINRMRSRQSKRKRDHSEVQSSSGLSAENIRNAVEQNDGSLIIRTETEQQTQSQSQTIQNCNSEEEMLGQIMLEQNQTEIISENQVIEQSDNVITAPVIPTPTITAPTITAPTITAPTIPVARKEITICKYCEDMERTGKPEHPIDLIVRESKYLHWYWVRWSDHSEKEDSEIHATNIHQSELYKFWQQQNQNEHRDVNLGYEGYRKICGASRSKKVSHLKSQGLYKIKGPANQIYNSLKERYEKIGSINKIFHVFENCKDENGIFRSKYDWSALFWYDLKQKLDQTKTETKYNLMDEILGSDIPFPTIIKKKRKELGVGRRYYTGIGKMNFAVAKTLKENKPIIFMVVSDNAIFKPESEFIHCNLVIIEKINQTKQIFFFNPLAKEEANVKLPRVLKRFCGLLRNKNQMIHVNYCLQSLEIDCQQRVYQLMVNILDGISLERFDFHDIPLK